jgi:hypothetical protein
MRLAKLPSGGPSVPRNTTPSAVPEGLRIELLEFDGCRSRWRDNALGVVRCRPEETKTLTTG